MKRAVVSYADKINANLLLGEWQPERYHAELLGSDVDWFMANAPCDTVFLRDRGLDSVDDVTVIIRYGTYLPLKMILADAVAIQYEAQMWFLTAIDEDAPEEQVTAITDYHRELEELCEAPTTSGGVRTSGVIDGLVSAAQDADVTVVGTVAHSRIHEFVFGDPATELSDRLQATVLLAHPHELKNRSFVRGLIEKIAF